MFEDGSGSGRQVIRRSLQVGKVGIGLAVVAADGWVSPVVTAGL